MAKEIKLANLNNKTELNNKKLPKIVIVIIKQELRLKYSVC